MRRSIAVVLLLLVSPPLPLWAAEMQDPAGLNCVILPHEQVEVSAPVPGVIAAVSVKRSDRVRHGQVVARLESSVEEATVALAQVRAATDAEIRLRRVEFGYDAQHHDRLRALHARRATSAQSLDDAERVAQAARLRVRLAEDRRREAMFERRRADAVLGLKTIRSPIDGVIVQRHKTVGEYVEDQPIVRIARLDPLRVEVIVPLALFGTVHEGMQVAVRPETEPDRERLATVTAVDAVADPGSGTFGVELQLPNPNLVLPAGIKCKGRVLASVAGDPAPVHPEADDDGALTSAELEDRVTVPAGRSEATSSTAVAAPGGDDAAGSCITYQAIDDEGQARALARTVEDMGGQAIITEVSEARASRYVVMTPAAAGPGQPGELLARLRDAGVSDLAVIHRGRHARRIALGTYNGPLSAERRRAALAERGIDGEVVVQDRAHRQWQVELRLPPGPDAGTAAARLRRVADGAAAQPRDCSPLRTAAR